LNSHELEEGAQPNSRHGGSARLERIKLSTSRRRSPDRESGEWNLANGLDPRNRSGSALVNPLDAYPHRESNLLALILNTSTP
jgi:hypothetical protein